MPNVRKAYEKYGKDGDFVVVGISLDNEDEKVAAFVRKHEIGWPQIVAGPADKNAVAKKYYVEGVPATFLIDPNGKVVAKDLRGSALQKEVDRQLHEMHRSKKKAESADTGVARSEDRDTDAK